MTRLTLEQANKLNTKRLLTYYKKYAHSFSKNFICSCCGEFIWDIGRGSKEDKEEYLKLTEYWKEIKTILTKKEHINE